MGDNFAPGGQSFLPGVKLRMDLSTEFYLNQKIALYSDLNAAFWRADSNQRSSLLEADAITSLPCR
jgi:hypothetical protein